MTPKDADQRVNLSRDTLYRFRRLLAAGHIVPAESIPLVEDEINLLDGIAIEHPGMVNQLITLVEQWVCFRDSVRVTVH